jgi:hypothetical protein
MKSIVFAVLCLLVGTMPYVATAQSEEPPAATPEAQSVTGSIVSSDGQTLVVRSDAGTAMTFWIDANTEVPALLTAGQRITVEYTSDEEHRHHATLASLVPETASEPEANPVTLSPSALPPPTSTRPREMPATASPLWWLALVGLVAAGGSFALRLHRR